MALKCFLSRTALPVPRDLRSREIGLPLGRVVSAAVTGVYSCLWLSWICCSAHPGLSSSCPSIWNRIYSPSHNQNHKAHLVGSQLHSVCFSGKLHTPLTRTRAPAQPPSIVCGLCGYRTRGTWRRPYSGLQEEEKEENGW